MSLLHAVAGLLIRSARWPLPLGELVAAMSFNYALAVATLALHLAWILWVVLGWLVPRNRPWLRWLHLGSLAYAIRIELFLWPCPLTYAENFFKHHAGLEPYSDSFLIHYLEVIIYPDINQTLITGLAVAVCAGILIIYAWRFHHRHAAANW